VRDMMGNELTVGDAVHVKVGNEWVIGSIMKVQNGGIAVTGIPKNHKDQVGVTMDALVVQLAVGFNQQPPGSNHVMVMKLAGPNAASSIIESSIKM
jgi:hypothetical protein